MMFAIHLILNETIGISKLKFNCCRILSCRVLLILNTFKDPSYRFYNSISKEINEFI